jgi:hypothetical protein
MSTAPGTHPLVGLVRTLFLFLTGKVVFIPASKGRQLTMENGQSFEVFRHVKVRTDAEEPGAVFIVRFKPYMSVAKNIRFSLLPMMIFMGFNGFREKYWAVDKQTGLCQGLYQWQTLAEAENYSRSIAMRFMTRRSHPESVRFQIIDQSKERYWAFR